MLERPAVKKIQAETGPTRALHLWVAMVLDVAGRATPIGQVLVVAADGDDEAAVMLPESDEQRLFVLVPSSGTSLRSAGSRACMTVDRAAAQPLNPIALIVGDPAFDVAGAEEEEWVVGAVVANPFKKGNPMKNTLGLEDGELATASDYLAPR